MNEMSTRLAGVQAKSTLEILKRKYSWNEDKSTSYAFPSDIMNARQMQKSKEYQVPTLYLLGSSTYTHLSWLELDLGITELAGEAGSGKTQISLGLCISCVMKTYWMHIQTVDGLNQETQISSKSLSVQPPTQMDPYRKQPVSCNNPYLSKIQMNATMPSPSSFVHSLPLDSASSHRNNKNPYLKMSSLTNLPQSDRNRDIPASDISKTGTIQNVLHEPKSTIPTVQSSVPTIATNQLYKQCFYKAIYISMGEGVSESQRAYRLNQMYTSRRLTLDTYSAVNTHDLDTSLSRIISKSIYNEEDFHEWLYQQLPGMLSRHNAPLDIQPSTAWNNSNNNKLQEERIGVIIIDSMAGLFRVSDENQSSTSSSWYVRRSGILFQAAAQMKQLSVQYSVPFVVVNQVSASEQGISIPALGFSWSYCLNSRYLISRREEYVPQTDEEEGTFIHGQTRFVRRIQLAFSPHFPSLQDCSFYIDNEGCKVK